jgi:hypothetical protein
VKHRKFVKQLQAHGLDRNAAGRLARHVQYFKWPYSKALGDFLTGADIRRVNEMAGCCIISAAPGTNLWEDLARKVGGTA